VAEVAHVVQAVLDLPVVSDQPRQLLGRGLLGLSEVSASLTSRLLWPLLSSCRSRSMRIAWYCPHRLAHLFIGVLAYHGVHLLRRRLGAQGTPTAGRRFAARWRTECG